MSFESSAARYGWKVFMNSRGLTFIEIAIVLALLSVLVISIMPSFINFKEDAIKASEEGVVGAVRSAVHLHYADTCLKSTCVFPNNLDSAGIAACDQNNRCFESVLDNGGIKDSNWEKTGNFTYKGPTDKIYVYNNVEGSFNLQ